MKQQTISYTDKSVLDNHIKAVLNYNTHIIILTNYFGKHKVNKIEIELDEWINLKHGKTFNKGYNKREYMKNKFIKHYNNNDYIISAFQDRLIDSMVSAINNVIKKYEETNNV